MATTAFEAAAELETYQEQLSHVQQALEADPTSKDLILLASELNDLIAITKDILAQQQSSSKLAESSKKPSAADAAAKAWQAGDECMAKYSSDGKWYPARITSVEGAESNRVFGVIFRGYNNTERLTASELKPLPASAQGAVSSGTKRKFSSKEEEEEAERKKKKNAKKLEVREAKAQEQRAKQDSWKKFTVKSAKKGVDIAGVNGKSIFKTPDNPLGKVGVTGSGKGMTENATRPKNKFTKEDSGVV